MVVEAHVNKDYPKTLTKYMIVVAQEMYVKVNLINLTI